MQDMCNSSPPSQCLYVIRALRRNAHLYVDDIALRHRKSAGPLELPFQGEHPSDEPPAFAFERLDQVRLRVVCLPKLFDQTAQGVGVFAVFGDEGAEAAVDGLLKVDLRLPAVRKDGEDAADGSDEDGRRRGGKGAPIH